MNIKEFVKRFEIKNIVCCFSGGKDSLVATHLTHKELQNMNITIKTVFVDTTVILPCVIEFVKEVSEKYGWDLIILKPKKSFWELAREWGSPTMHRRWCCYNLKLEPIIEFMKKLEPPRAEITGLRREESVRRKDLPQLLWKKKSKSWAFAPIIDWKEEDVMKYIRENNLPLSPHYSLGIGESCICGAFMNWKDIHIVKANFPEFFEKFLNLEKNFKMGGACFFLKNKPYYAKEIAKQKTLDFYGEEK